MKNKTINPILSFRSIRDQAILIMENTNRLPFHDVSFQYGAEWSRDTLICEIERRRQIIMSEPEGIIRETMLSNLLIDIK
jgi:hypothetical protein